MSLRAFSLHLKYPSSPGYVSADPACEPFAAILIERTQVATGGSVAVVGFCFVQLIVSANLGLALESEDGLIGYGLD